jgi:hypothetical protein
MDNKRLFLVLIGILLLVCGLYYFHQTDGTAPVPGIKGQLKPASAHQATLPPMEKTPEPSRSGIAFVEKTADAPAYHPKDIEEIKKQVYALNIESVEDIPLLDRVIQTGDAPTRDFWKGDWVSVDDNKQDMNGFYLQPQDDGTFVYFPDENSTRTYTFFETPKTYTYDPVKREFFWEIDYYGKTISHRARFINDNVLAMMLISGSKVTLDLYQKNPAQ